MKGRTVTGSNCTGVSESIGFLLIFTIVIMGIALVTLYGYPLLLRQQVGADESIMEKNMIVLQNDIKSIVYKNVPEKETSLKIGGGSLAAYNGGSGSSAAINIFYDGNSYPSFQSGDLLYSSVSAQTDISLQNGAVVLRPRISQGTTKGSVMLAEPRWFYDSSTIPPTMVIDLIRITSDNQIAREGIGTVRMKSDDTGISYLEVPVNSLRVEYIPDPVEDYSLAWDNYIRNTFPTEPGIFSSTGTPGTGETLRYRWTTPMNLVIKEYEVKVESV